VYFFVYFFMGHLLAEYEPRLPWRSNCLDLPPTALARRDEPMSAGGMPATHSAVTESCPIVEICLDASSQKFRR
jgi:hypothetical protein